jgi:hypothetical protein
MFQGQFGGFDSTDHNRPIIQLKVDGVNVGLAVVGSDVTHVGLIPGLETFGYNAFTNLAAGTHTASVEWHTFPIGAKSCVEERSLIVLHR